MSEGKSPRAVILWLIGLSLLVASLGAFLGSTRSPLRAMAAALLFLPAGLWMLLPVGRESWPNGIGELALCAAYCSSSWGCSCSPCAAARCCS